MKVALIAILFAMFTGAPAAASDDDNESNRAREIDQAIVGETAALLEEGELEVSFSTSFEHDVDIDTIELVIEVEYGLTGWLEIGVSFPYQFLNPRGDDEKNVDGIGDVTLEASVPVLADYPLLVAASLAVTLPTGDHDKDNGLGEGRVIWEPSITMDVSVGEAELVLAVGGELGGGTRVFNYSVLLVYPLDVIIPSIGVEGSLDGDEKGAYIVPGVGFELVEDVEIGIEIPIGMSSDSSDWKAILQVTFEF